MTIAVALIYYVMPDAGQFRLSPCSMLMHGVDRGFVCVRRA